MLIIQQEFKQFMKTQISSIIKLLEYFKKITNCPIIVNTSFNVRDEPIVCTIQDAYKCFMGTDLDMLVCGNFILYKDKQRSQ